MSKLDEKQIEKTHKSAAGQEDKAFEEWISQRVLDETAEMINGLENDPDLDDFEPSEELFQKIVGVAKERGLLAEADETAEDEIEEDVVKIELSDDEIQEKILDLKKPSHNNINISNNKAFHNRLRKRLVMKLVATIAIILIGVFGMSMSSQANRTFVMQKIDEAFGDGNDTVIENNDNRITSEDKEELDRKSIEEILEIKLPVFFYSPNEMSYVDSNIDQGAQTAILQYMYNSEAIYMMVFANYKDASGIYKNDKGSRLNDVHSELADIDIELWEVFEEGDKKPTYIAQWDYKNSFYEIVGKIHEDEMKNILEKIVY